MKLNQKIKTILPLAAFAIVTTSAQAAVIVTTADANSAAVSDDLLQTSFLSESLTLDKTSLRDGAAISSAAAYNWGGNGNLASGTIIDYTLDTSVNTAGYQIDQIDLFHGWKDAGRDRIDNFSVAYATVTAPTTFVDIITGADSGDFASTFGRTRVEDNGAAPLATGAAVIRLTFTDVENNAVGISEIDVLGSPSAIPEPSTTALLGLGGLALILRRRRG